MNRMRLFNKNVMDPELEKLEYYRCFGAKKFQDKGVTWKPDVFLLDMGTGKTQVYAHLTGYQPPVETNK